MNRVEKAIKDWPDNIKVDEATRNAKLDICKSCSNFLSDERIQKGTCSLCGCDMLVLTWSKPMGVCPIGKFKGEAL
jgi:hypothetical protein